MKRFKVRPKTNIVASTRGKRRVTASSEADRRDLFETIMDEIILEVSNITGYHHEYGLTEDIYGNNVAEIYGKFYRERGLDFICSVGDADSDGLSDIESPAWKRKIIDFIIEEGKDI